MAREYRPYFTIYDYSVFNTALVPKAGERIHFDTVMDEVQNVVLSIIGDGTSAVSALPFVEMIICESDVNFSLEDLRITGNVALVQNTHASNTITVNIGTTGTPVNSLISAGDQKFYKFDGSNWKLVINLDNTFTNVINLEDSSTTGSVVQLDSAAANTSEIIKVVKTNADATAVTILPYGSETINGLSAIFLTQQYQTVELKSDGTNWLIVGGKLIADSGWINRSDWTNIHAGTAEVDIDGGSTPLAFQVGEIVTESTSGNTGIIVKITDAGGGAGTLYLHQVTGTGIFTDGRTLTGSLSTDTATVNEGSGSTKNLDSNFYHGFGQSSTQIKKRFLISSDKTEANTWEIAAGVDDNTTTRFGYVTHGVDTNNIKIQSGAGGVRILIDDGTSTPIDTEDYYYRNIMEIIF